jgi:hypothetical protein
MKAFGVFGTEELLLDEAKMRIMTSHRARRQATSGESATRMPMD